MICKPEEARNYFCCKDLSNKCQANACMAWKWVIGGNVTGVIDAQKASKHSVIGYCGLTQQVP